MTETVPADQVDHVDRTLSRKEGKAVTRSRLLEAALGILDTEGEAALTTISVTRRAGIAQSSFYVHFRDMDDLLRGLIDTLTVQRLELTRAARREAQAAPADTEAWRATFRVPIEHSIAHPELFRLLARSRHDRSTPLGAWSRAAFDENRQALADDLVDAGMPHRSQADRRRLQMAADGIVSLTETMTAGHLEGRYPDLEEIVDTLTAFSMGYFVMRTGSRESKALAEKTRGRLGGNGR